VIHLENDALAGYVQATVRPDGTVFVAYELNSRYWRQGIRQQTVQVIDEQQHRDLDEPDEIMLMCSLGSLRQTQRCAAFPDK
jgi:transcription initiation factor IIE alpha subunit